LSSTDLVLSEEKLAELKAKAKRMLADSAGRKEMMADIAEGLVVAMLAEKEEGLNVRPGVSGPMHARASRKQYKELAELVMQVTQDLLGKDEPKGPDA
jgi:hypothetical protein